MIRVAMKQDSQIRGTVLQTEKQADGTERWRVGLDSGSSIEANSDAFVVLAVIAMDGAANDFSH